MAAGLVLDKITAVATAQGTAPADPVRATRHDTVTLLIPDKYSLPVLWLTSGRLGA